ncbi:MAG: J domain-containing protein [Solirubrobacterales bacterium]|nr:J domain-containing protein [Solirubrobacterales bacterium]
MAADPYQILGISRSSGDAEVRAAYRRLVQVHHPDHNGGSQESARRFEEVQDAYAEVRRLRASGAGARGGAGSRGGGSRATTTAASPGAEASPDIGARLAAMEAELRATRDEAMRQARRAAARAKQPERANDEELGIFSTDDSFGKIFADAASELSDRLSDARDGAERSDAGRRFAQARDRARSAPATKRFAELIDELGSRLTGEPPDHS